MLFQIDIPEVSDERKQSILIRNLKRAGFHRSNYNYVNNYVGNQAVLYKHIKNAYQKYVLDGDLDKHKFVRIIAILINKDYMIIDRNIVNVNETSLEDEPEWVELVIRNYK